MGVLNADRVNAGIFSGDGSLLSNITAVGTGLAVENSGVLVGTALTLDFNQGVDVQFSGGIATITSQAATWQGNQTGTFTLGSVGENRKHDNSSHSRECQLAVFRLSRSQEGYQSIPGARRPKELYLRGSCPIF